MNDIYIEISKQTDRFRKIAHGITNDTEKINEAVQELMLYFLQMNPDRLKNIYEKDGINGVVKYGAIAIKRALTSTRSNFYYKYDKYYTHIDSNYYHSNITGSDDDGHLNNWSYQTIANLPEDTEEGRWQKLKGIEDGLERFGWYDRELFKLYYYEGNTLDSLAEKTRISRNSLFSTIKKVRTILKKELNEDV